MRAMLAYVSGVEDSFPEFLRADADDAGERATVDVEALSSDDESSATEIGGVASAEAPAGGTRTGQPRAGSSHPPVQYLPQADPRAGSGPPRPSCCRYAEKMRRRALPGLEADRGARGLFDVIDREDLDALDPTDEEDAERIEALHEQPSRRIAVLSWRGGLCRGRSL